MALGSGRFLCPQNWDVHVGMKCLDLELNCERCVPAWSPRLVGHADSQSELSLHMIPGEALSQGSLAGTGFQAGRSGFVGTGQNM